MKFFAVFAAVLAISAAAPTTHWTLSDLSHAIENPATSNALLPYLEHALNTMMAQLFAGEPVDSVVVPTPAGLLPVEAVASPAAVMPVIVKESTTQWTLSDLTHAIENPATPNALLPYLEHALNTMMAQLFAGEPVDSVVVPTPTGLLPVEAIASPVAVMPVIVEESTTQWTLSDLTHAIENPATPTALLPYLEHALNTMMAQLFAGEPVDSVVVPTPTGLLSLEAIASPAAVMPVIVEEPVAPVAVVEPTPAAVIADATGSPLVQIIVNIKSSETAAAPEAPTTAVEPSPVAIPMPVIVVDEVSKPEPVIVVDEAVQPAPVPAPIVIAPAPAPIVIAPAPAPIEITPVPAPIVIAPAPAPIVIAPTPVVIPEANPIDVIAVGTPEVNPIDLLQPVPVAAGAGDSQGIIV